ncbi:hypothetical protein J5N97_018082 [Dioscorea zingiberensis]|uniref:RING-type domain-containing protein n=1 Tax=Dioscorea zingiberensis TaxID=325984 RepID=A0A9D5CND3_9LILI|nr:hypothetical protein J5N97_018082 [Dioscorea zingiberensis]
MSAASFSSPIPQATATATATTTGVGLGYGIAIAVGILVLVSTIMLASYLCVRVKGRAIGNHHHHHHHRRHTTAAAAAVDSASATTPTTLTLGLDRPTIDSFPEFLFGSNVTLPRPITEPCPICLSEYKTGEAIRRVPDCEHCFHSACVDVWLQVSASCPLCRSSPVPSAASTPLATPLSELIPLAVHAR